MLKTTRPRARVSWVLAGSLVLLPLPASASVIHLVDSMDNLYFTDWGHPYNVPPFNDGNNEFGAIGRGDPAQPVAADFAGFDQVVVSATGSNAINGSTSFGPDGNPPALFRALTVYSLIGVWSSSSAAILPLGNAFFIGDSAILPVPSSPAAFLWLGFNDGKFDDNLDQPSPGFSVTLTGVPEPSTLGLFVLALGLLRASRRRSRA
jgi:hypothetical protein